jgi:hypothetical protein
MSILILLTFNPISAAGDWKGECHDSMRFLHHHDGRNRIVTMQLFSDQSCEHMIAFYKSHSSYRISSTGIGNIDFTIKDLVFTVTDQTTANYYSKYGFFGFTDWKVNIPRNVAGLYFVPTDKDERQKMPAEGKSFYGIQSVDGISD